MNSMVIVVLSVLVGTCVVESQPDLPFIVQGQCPVVKPGTIGSCIIQCRNDSQCRIGRKCCYNGCGRVCRVPCPVPRCPVCLSGTELFIRPNGCRACRCRPNPCRGIICGPNEVCRLRRVQCFRPPCNPIPVCVRRFPRIG